MKPCETGWYWLKMPRSDAEIVYVAMDYTCRNKTVPRVIGKFWSDPLHKIPDECKWSERIISPQEVK